MRRGAFLGLPLLWALAVPAAANNPGQEAYMTRVLSCKGSDADMEVYISQSIVQRVMALRARWRSR